MSAIIKRDAIDAAMSVAEDVAKSRLDPAKLDQAVANECKALFGTVVGEGDSLWPLHADVARQVLAVGGLSADELSEWLAVARSRAGEPLSSPLPPIDTSADTASASEAISPAIDLTEPGLGDGDEIDLSGQDEPEPEPDPTEAAGGECGCGTNTSAMVDLPDGRRIARRLIAARGRGLPSDDRL